MRFRNTKLQKADIVFDFDNQGKEYVTIQHDFLLKNWRGLNGRELKSFGHVQEAHQVEAMHKLLAKLHTEVDRIFQAALLGPQAADKQVWFDKMPLGHVVSPDIMPRI